MAVMEAREEEAIKIKITIGTKTTIGIKMMNRTIINRRVTIPLQALTLPQPHTIPLLPIILNRNQITIHTPPQAALTQAIDRLLMITTWDLRKESTLIIKKKRIHTQLTGLHNLPRKDSPKNWPSPSKTAMLNKMRVPSRSSLPTGTRLSNLTKNYKRHIPNLNAMLGSWQQLSSSQLLSCSFVFVPAGQWLKLLLMMKSITILENHMLLTK